MSSGIRTVSVAARTQSGSGTLRIYDPVISVVTIPVSSAAICSSEKVENYENATTDYTAAATCNITLPSAARIMAFASATLSAGWAGGTDGYEANLRIAVDDLVGLANSDRWVDLYLDSALGYLRVADVQALREVGAGAHTVPLVSKLWRGPGRVSMTDGYLHTSWFCRQTGFSRAATISNYARQPVGPAGATLIQSDQTPQDATTTADTGIRPCSRQQNLPDNR